MNILKKFFTNKDKTPVKPAIDKKHISKKRKDTYIVTNDVMLDYNSFAFCQEVPVAIKVKNGVIEQSGWKTCKCFPTKPVLHTMNNQPQFVEIFGEKIATTIIEYHDKDTNMPVAQLYPDSLCVFDGFEKNYEQRLNHATRQDLKYQMALRQKLLNKYENQR